MDRNVKSSKPRLLQRFFTSKKETTKEQSPSKSVSVTSASSTPQESSLKQKDAVSISADPTKAGRQPRVLGLWGDAYSSFLVAPASADLKAIAQDLQQQSQNSSSLTASRANINASHSHELHLCHDVLQLALSKESDLSQAPKTSSASQAKHLYNEIITWTQKFVAIGDFVAQVDPVHIGLPWAAFRAIMIFATHGQELKATLLQKVAELSKLICRYATFEEIYLAAESSITETLKCKLKDGLKALYLAVFRYLVEVVSYLHHSSSAQFVKSINLSEKFAELESDITKNEQDVLRHETMSIKAASHQQYIDIRRRLCLYEDYTQSQQRKVISDWISNIDYHSDHREMKSRVFFGTGKWFLAKPEFTNWDNSPESSLLWLRGNAGTGKTCVTILERPWLDSRDGFAYFYCSRTRNDAGHMDPRAILSSILRQLAAPLPGLPLKAPIISTYEKETSRGSQRASLTIVELVELLDDLIQNHYDRVTLIFDALDEIGGHQRSDILDAITRLTYNPATTVKTFVSSRNDADLEAHFSRAPSLAITDTDNAEDIANFVKNEISKRLLNGRARKQLKDAVESHLVSKANGVFRWVALQVDALCDAERVYTEDDVRYLLPRLPETLEDTYAVILEDLSRLSPASRSAVENVLKMLLCARYPLTRFDLQDVLVISHGSAGRQWSLSNLLKIGRGLIVGSASGFFLAFAHLSVKEFLESRKGFGIEAAHALAAELCLKVYLECKSELEERSSFRRYARTQLGRHCSESGVQRHAPKLSGLMKEFLVTKKYAFEKWNSECSLTIGNIQRLYPDLSVEIRRCQSQPAQSLFFVCVYGFHEFLDSILSSNEGIFFAENYYGERPLEVASIYGNFEAVKKLYEVALALPMSPIRTKVWLEAAASGENLDIWNYAVERVPSLPFEVAAIHAVRNEKHGSQMLESLLSELSIIDHNCFIKMLRCCASLEALNVALTRCQSTIPSQASLEATVANQFLNPALLESTLSQHCDIEVTEYCFVSLLRMHHKQPLPIKLKMLRLLLAWPHRCKITEEMVCMLAEYGQTSEDVDCLGVLIEHLSLTKIPEDMMISAAANIYQGPKALALLLSRPARHVITQSVLQSALANKRGARGCFEILSQQSDCPRLLEETIYMVVEAWPGGTPILPTILNAAKPFHVTETFLQKCAMSRSKREMSFVLALPRAIPISERVVVCSVDNCSDEVLQLLLQKTDGFELQITDDLLYQAVSNPSNGMKIACALVKSPLYDPSIVSRRTISEAVKKQRGLATFLTLTEDGESANHFLTTDILLAAIHGGNVEFVNYFRQRQPSYVVTENMLLAAVENYVTNNAILRVLLSQTNRCQISLRVLQWAVDNNNTSALELFLQQPDAPKEHLGLLEKLHWDLLSLSVDHGAITLAGELESSSKGAFPSMSSVALSTQGLDSLLTQSEYLSTEHDDLVEVAACRANGKFVLQYLFARFPDIAIPQIALENAARNELASPSLLELLLVKSCTKVDEQLLVLAAGNTVCGTQMFEMLLSRCPDSFRIPEDVVLAAVSNSYCGLSLLAIISERQPDVCLSHAVIDVACENETFRGTLLHMFLKRALAADLGETSNLILEKLGDFPHGVRDCFFTAACGGDTSVLDYLISRDFSISTVSGELGTPLNVAVYANQQAAVLTLLKHGSSPESRSHLYGTALETACEQGHLQIMRILVENGATIDGPKEFGRTRLHLALRNGHQQIAETLVDLGASTTKKDSQGMSAVHHAAVCQSFAGGISQLLSVGGSTEDIDSHQWTPLHWAAKHGNIDIVLQLLQHGADITAVDASRRTPLDVAIMCGNIHLRPKLWQPGIERDDLLGQRHTAEQHGATCDACDMRIWGSRYKCQQCDDFDFCFRCVVDAKAIHDPVHEFEEIPFG